MLEKAADVDVPLDNNGSDAEIEDIEPGATGTLTFTFTEAGEFMLACHVPGHFEGGMLTKFQVTE